MRTFLHDAPFVHQNDLVAEVSGFGQIVRDENGGLFQAAQKFPSNLSATRREQADRARRVVRRAGAIRERA